MTDENLKKAIFLNNRIKDIEKFLEEFSIDKPMAISCLQSPAIRIHPDDAEMTDGVSEEARKAIREVIINYKTKLQHIYDSI